MDGTSHWTCAPTMKISRGKNGAPPPRTIIVWQRAVGGALPIRSLPAAISGQPIPGWGSLVPGSDLMAATHVPAFSRTGWHSKSTLAVSLVLSLTCPVNVGPQRLLSNGDISSVNNEEGVSHLTDKTHGAIHLIWLTHLLGHCFNQKTSLSRL